MAIVNWETFWADANDKTNNWFAVEVQDNTDAIRRVHWKVKVGWTLRVEVGSPHDISETVEATAITGEMIGSRNIPGNERMIVKTDDQGDYLAPAWDYSVSFFRNGLG